MTSPESLVTGSATPPAFPFGRECPFAPSRQYGAAVQPPRRITFKGKDAWLVSGLETVREVLADHRVSVRGMDDSTRGDSGDEDAALPGFFVAMDPPEHDNLRRVLVREFTPRRVAALRPAIEKIATELVDGMLAGPKPVDLVEALALPFPSLVICELLGVPYKDHDFFQEHTRAVLAATSTQEQVGAAIGAVMGYLGELAAAKQQQPGDDLLSLLVHHVDSGAVSLQDVVGMATLLLMAGHETTGNMIALGTFALLEHPEQLAQVRADNTLMPQAVEELLRHLDIIGNLPRMATEDLEIGGQHIAAGEIMVMSTEIANRDPAMFENPDTLDFSRNTRRHVAFGHGIHVCLGAPLARLELEVLYSTLFQRIPELRLAVPADEIGLKNDAKIFGVHELPVTW